MPNASVTVTNNSDLNDSREINFEYLKHVVLKFMSCRESEVKVSLTFSFYVCLSLEIATCYLLRTLYANSITLHLKSVQWGQ